MTSSNLFKESMDALHDDPKRFDSKYTTSTTRFDWEKILKSYPPQERSNQVSLRRLGRAREAIKLKEKCRYCWLHRPMCTCAWMGRLFPIASVTAPTFTVLMHPREFSRITNSGKLLGCLLGCEILIAWLPHTTQRLKELCETQRDRLCVLYPHPDAISIEDYLGTYSARQEEVVVTTPGSCETAIRPPPHVILIDSTWNEAKALNLFFPEEIPRVVLPLEMMEAHVSLFRHIRSRTRASGVCTAEAAALFFRSAGFVKEAETVLDALRFMVDVVALEKNKRQAFHVLPPEYLKLRRISVQERSVLSISQGHTTGDEKKKKTKKKSDVEDDDDDDSDEDNVDECEYLAKRV
eukprot:PhF_6_TR37703/c0_g1_i1/m.56120